MFHVKHCNKYQLYTFNLGSEKGLKQSNDLSLPTSKNFRQIVLQLMVTLQISQKILIISN